MPFKATQATANAPASSSNAGGRASLGRRDVYQFPLLRPQIREISRFAFAYSIVFGKLDWSTKEPREMSGLITPRTFETRAELLLSPLLRNGQRAIIPNQ